MKTNYSSGEILEAIQILLEKKKKIEIKKKKKNQTTLPKDTESIIFQAEKFLKE